MGKFPVFPSDSIRKLIERGENMPNISIYLRREELELLDIIAKALKKNRSGAVQYMLKEIDDWINIFKKKNPELVKVIIKEMLDANQKI